MIRIGLDARPLSTRVSGVGRLISETIKHFPQKEKYQFVLFSHLPIHETHESILELPNIEFHQGKGILSKKGALYYNILLPFEISKYKLDLFWGSQQVIPPIFQNIPVVLTYCDLVLYKFPEAMRFLARLQQKMVQRYSVNKAKFILNISEQTRTDLVEKFSLDKNKTGIAYPGIDVNEIQNFLKQKSKYNIEFDYMLSVSTIEPRKNYPFLLNVFKEYRKISNQKLKWIIIGKKGWESKEFYKELEEEMKLGDIFLFDSVNDIELHHFYKNAKLFLFASIYEGFGIPLLEALVHKSKCLVADIPTFREIGGDKIQYLKTDNPVLWAEKIHELENSSIQPEIDLDIFSWTQSSMNTKIAFDKVLENFK